MIDVMKELFILRVASALRIGPRFDNIYGFDIILYRNAIEFSMEFCDSPRENDSNTLKEHLKDKLGLLHRCHIVHSDIKP
jgi:serine/threonine protein kinase